MMSPGFTMLPCPPPAAWRRSFLSRCRSWRLAPLCICLVCFAGACAPRPQGTAPDREPFAALSDKTRGKAIEYENRGEPRQALLHWWILQSLNPRDKEIAARVERLRQETRAKATEHFQQGVAFYQQGKLIDARREFLNALTYEQDHPEAVDYLLNRLHDKVFITYQAQQGDTCREVARKVYHDPAREFLVAAFNEEKCVGEVSPGAELRLVVLDQDQAGGGESAAAVPRQDEARVLLVPGRQKRKVMEDAYHRVEAGAAGEPRVAEGGAEQNAARYRQAMELLGLREYVKALRMLRTIDANYRDVAKLVAATETHIQQEADAHYRKGVSYYLSENLDKAIQEWEEVLRLRPDDPKAKKDLLNARRLKEKSNKF